MYWFSSYSISKSLSQKIIAGCLFLIIFVSFFFPLDSEVNASLPLPVTEPDTVNRIINSASGLNHFFSRLAMLENRETDLVAVYHFGDSHVAAIALPNGVAEFLQLNFGFAGREAFKEAPTKPTRKTRRKKRASLFEITTPLPQYTIVENSVPPAFFFELDDFSLPPLEEKRGVRYYSYGYTGKSFNFFSKSEKILNHIKEVNADLVIVTLGTNDAYGPAYSEQQIKSEIGTIIGNIRKINSTCSILLITPPDSFVKRKTSNKNLPSVRNAIVESALKVNVACWDFFSVMGGPGSMDRWVSEGLAGRDKIHLTSAGYVKQAELLNYALMLEYQQFIKKYNDAQN